MADSKRHDAEPKRPPGVELSDDRVKITMWPLDTATALVAALKAPPPPKPKRPGRQKKEQPPKE